MTGKDCKLRKAEDTAFIEMLLKVFGSDGVGKNGTYEHVVLEII